MKHSPECLRYNRGRSLHDADCFCCDHQLETGMCEGCGNQFEVGELDEIAAIDPDLHWCEACRVVCEHCGHILGVHAIVVRDYRLQDGCDGNHGELGECVCVGFAAKVPRAVVARAKAIGGIWMSDRFRQELRRKR